MMTSKIGSSCATLLVAMSLSAASAHAASTDKDLTCDGPTRDTASFCEMREQVVPAAGTFSVDALQNGGISIRGSNRPDVLIRARVSAHSRTPEDAHTMVQAVRLESTSARVRANGPAQYDRENWSVSYEILVPNRTSVTLRASNGGISVKDVAGEIDAKTVNGGLAISGLAGNLHGETVNGGISVDLAGDHWEGAGMDLSTVNGGVRLTVPDGYSARVEASTVNGGVHSELATPVRTTQGHQMSFTLGNGGPLLHLSTTNGGISIQKKKSQA